MNVSFNILAHRVIIDFLLNSEEWFKGGTVLSEVRRDLQRLLSYVNLNMQSGQRISNPKDVDWSTLVQALKLNAVPGLFESLEGLAFAIDDSSGGDSDIFIPDKALKLREEPLNFLKMVKHLDEYLDNIADLGTPLPVSSILSHFLDSLDQLPVNLLMSLHPDNINPDVALARIEALKLAYCLRTAKEAANGLRMIGGDEGSALETIPAAHRPVIEAAIFEIERLNGDQDPLLRLFIMCAKGVLAGEPSCFRLLHHCLSIDGDISEVISRIELTSGVEVQAETQAEPKLVLKFEYAVNDKSSAEAVARLNKEFFFAAQLGLVTIRNVGISEKQRGVQVLVGPLVTDNGGQGVFSRAHKIVTSNRGPSLEFLT